MQPPVILFLTYMIFRCFQSIQLNKPPATKMNSRDYYKVTYSRDDNMDSHEILDNETEFNANQFKLYDDFTTDLRISFNPLRNNYHEIRDNRRRGDPNDSGVDMENGNTHASTSRDSDLVSCGSA